MGAHLGGPISRGSCPLFQATVDRQNVSSVTLDLIS